MYTFHAKLRRWQLREAVNLPGVMSVKSVEEEREVRYTNSITMVTTHSDTPAQRPRGKWGKP